MKHFVIICGFATATVLGRVAVEAGVISSTGAVTALTDVGQMSGVYGTAGFDEGPTSGGVPLDAYAAQGLTFHKGKLADILPGVTAPGPGDFDGAWRPEYVPGSSDIFPSPIAGGGVQAGQFAMHAGVATFSETVGQVGLTAGRNNVQFLTAWDQDGAMLGQVKWNPFFSDAAFVGIDTGGTPIGMIAYGNDDLWNDEVYSPLGPAIYSDTWIWAAGETVVPEPASLTICFLLAVLGTAVYWRRQRRC